MVQDNDIDVGHDEIVQMVEAVFMNDEYEQEEMSRKELR